MDLRFWNYVIPDGSTTNADVVRNSEAIWNYVNADGCTSNLGSNSFYSMFWNYVIPDGSTT